MDLTSTGWLTPLERTHAFPFEFRLTDQTGQRLQKLSLLGKPFAATYLYTRCENTNKCPLVARTFGKLQALLQGHGLESRVNLLLMTYDPENDSSSRLTAFSEQHELHAQRNTWLVRPDPADKKKLFERLNVAVNFNQNDVNAHRIEIMLFDSQARFVRSYHSLIWDNTAGARDLLRLAQEP
jgi:protein SCO1/2